MEGEKNKMIPVESIFLSRRSLYVWRAVQSLVWLGGFFIFFCLLFFPSLGLLLFWNILIPVAPALLVVATGLWRNICPLATTQLFPRHFNLSKKRKMPVGLQAKLQLISVLSLFLIVPLRHAIFNTNGMATALLLFLLSAVAISMGMVYDWKSGWCSTLCPVHPVERLYGTAARSSFPNAHCESCVNCSIPCPDSTPNFSPGLSRKTHWHTWSGTLTAGGLPGFVWGWFQIPDQHGINSWFDLVSIYRRPFLGLAISLTLFILIKMAYPKIRKQRLISFFAASAVSCYYWFRVPALVGLGDFGEDGVLYDLKNSLPAEWVTGVTVLTTLFFFWWLLIRKSKTISWLIRPPFQSRSL